MSPRVGKFIVQSALGIEGSEPEVSGSDMG